MGIEAIVSITLFIILLIDRRKQDEKHNEQMKKIEKQTDLMADEAVKTNLRFQMHRLEEDIMQYVARIKEKDNEDEFYYIHFYEACNHIWNLIKKCDDLKKELVLNSEFIKDVAECEMETKDYMKDVNNRQLEYDIKIENLIKTVNKIRFQEYKQNTQKTLDPENTITLQQEMNINYTTNYSEFLKTFYNEDFITWHSPNSEEKEKSKIQHENLIKAIKNASTDVFVFGRYAKFIYDKIINNPKNESLKLNMRILKRQKAKELFENNSFKIFEEIHNYQKEYFKQIGAEENKANESKDTKNEE